MLDNSLRNLVDTASAYAREHCDNEDHSVAATLLTKSGRHLSGMNSYHFLGGACGETAALSLHTQMCPDDPIDTVVAVYGPTNEVISPCGKCRQVLFDLDPHIRCIVRSSNGLVAPTVAELLPNPFDWRSLERKQKIFMWEGYEDSIRCGEKSQTIRIDDPFHVGPADVVFEKENGETISLPAYVERLERITREDLTQTHALRDGFGSLAELHEALDRHYPGLGNRDCVDVVTFRLKSDQPN
ncbi:ASCH domain-containing protein [Corynebacterium urogenitale]